MIDRWRGDYLNAGAMARKSIGRSKVRDGRRRPQKPERTQDSAAEEGMSRMVEHKIKSSAENLASPLVAGSDGAQTLLLLDAAGAGVATWISILGPLAEQFRIVQPLRDAKATAPTIESLGHAAVEALDAVKCARANIAGCGLGGAVALWIAIHFPERVARIAVIGSAANVTEPALWGDIAARLRAGNTESVVDTLIGGWLTPGLRGRDAALVASLSKAVASYPPADLAALAEETARQDLRQDLGRIAAPALILVGDEDPFVGATSIQELANALPQSKLERISNAAHLATVEQPARVVKALLDHFGSAASLEIGFRSRRVALGDPHVDKTIAAITPFTRPFQEFLTRYCWGEVWTRTGLSRRDRSLVTIAALVAIGAEHEIPVHVRAGLRHGLKIEEFPELYEQLALYTGLPRAFGALNITQKTLIEDGHIQAQPGS